MFWKKVCAMMLTVLVVLTVSASGLGLAAEAARQTATVTEHLYKDNENLKYPQVSDMENIKLQEKINRDFDKYIKEAYKAAKDVQKQAEKYGFEGEFLTTYEVKYNKQPRLSILTSDYMFSGGAHGNTVVQSFNYDAEEGKRVYLTDVLTTEEQIKKVQNYVWEYAIERPDIFYPDLKKEDIQLTKDTAFYFSDDGIVLVFQQYEIAPYVSGNQEISIPKEIYEKA
ncbi:DUF3298 and DUF4163 domain-containing protein [Gracilibacillus oryzae]|uniref:DUF3298 and DUF4163 domain-containing protein n=1 Tax=Gracilibacillus oryzae TaxID=1672701 RepID=A0A7C8GV90_9BACI|nr:DUF3298 and DUF4163 domain-containing protein [Gracilibacillus oryzae]KAB8139081.1 DUF3298 and DUF4163 domain-containing protein [Gracilibacillus oryzae]